MAKSSKHLVKKPLTNVGFSYLLLWIVIVVYRRLFADTKLTEDRA
jgi:hypothetical protein